jgi:hypothetical protein
VDIGDTATRELIGQIEIGFLDLGINGVIEELAIRREANRRALGPDRGDDRIEGLEQETGAAFERVTAIGVSAVVDVRIEELLDQIAIGAMQFDAIEAGRDRVARGLERSPRSHRALPRC